MDRRLTPIVLLAGLLAACGKSAPGDSGPPLSAETVVRVRNQDFIDVTVYVVRMAQRVRLGTVSSLATRVFTIPGVLVGAGADLQFLIDPIGSSRTPITQAIYVQPGQVVELDIPPQAR